MPRYTQRIPFVTCKGGDPDFAISDSNWKRIERAYGHAICPELRTQVQDATWGFLAFVESEQAAAPVADVRRKIESIAAAAFNLQKEILEMPGGANVAGYAHELINQNLRDPRITGKLRVLGSVMVSLVCACQAALKELTIKRGPRKGATWEVWVLELTKMLDARALPTQARKDSDKNKTDSPSPFVAFVNELQILLPEAHRRSAQSLDALAKAIHEARNRQSAGRKAKRRKSGRKAEQRHSK